MSIYQFHALSRPRQPRDHILRPLNNQHCCWSICLTCWDNLHFETEFSSAAGDLLAGPEIENSSYFTFFEVLKKMCVFASRFTHFFRMRWSPNTYSFSFRVAKHLGFSKDAKNCNARSGFGTVAEKGSTERCHCSEEFLVANRDQLGLCGKRER